MKKKTPNIKKKPGMMIIECDLLDSKGNWGAVTLDESQFILKRFYSKEDRAGVSIWKGTNGDIFILRKTLITKLQRKSKYVGKFNETFNKGGAK